MTFVAPALGDYDLDLLDEYLSLPDHSDGVMLLSHLDGYLTAIALAPRTIPPSEWLPGIWGGSAPAFTDNQLADAIHGAIMGLYDDVLHALADDAAPFEPIFSPDLDGSPIADLWAQGFVRGVVLRPDDWKPLFDDEEILAAMIPIAFLGSGTEAHDAIDMTEKEREGILATAWSVIPDSVRAMRSFWREKGLGPSAPPLPRVGLSRRSLWLAQLDALSAVFPFKMQAKSTKVGRNSPCPCSSGKKYKRCCGA